MTAPHNKSLNSYKSLYIDQFFKVANSSTQIPPTHGSNVSEDHYVKVEIYTDGSCKGNGKKHAQSAFAFQIYVNDILEHQHAAAIEGTTTAVTTTGATVVTKKTNQRAELLAILEALRFVRKNFSGIICDPNNFVTVYSDSEYSIKCITEWCKNWDESDWAKKKNTDILRDILAIYSNLNISFKHVRAHTAATDKHSLRNALVDKLAQSKI